MLFLSEMQQPRHRRDDKTNEQPADRGEQKGERSPFLASRFFFDGRQRRPARKVQQREDERTGCGEPRPAVGQQQRPELLKVFKIR